MKYLLSWQYCFESGSTSRITYGLGISSCGILDYYCMPSIMHFNTLILVSGYIQVFCYLCAYTSYTAICISTSFHTGIHNREPKPKLKSDHEPTKHETLAGKYCSVCCMLCISWQQ